MLRPLRHAAAFAALALALAAAPVSPASAASLDGLAVAIENRTVPALCAGARNVALTLASEEARRFTIVAAHPAFLPMLGASDAPAADLLACASEAAPAAAPAEPPVRNTLYEDAGLRLVGVKRPGGLFAAAEVPVRVGDAQPGGYALVELWVTQDGRSEPVLTLETATGLWRMRPLAPEGRGTTSFGAGAVIGPLQDLDEGKGERLRTRIESVVFAPRARTMQLAFVEGGGAAVRLAELDRERLVLEVVFDRPVVGRPFTAIVGDHVTRSVSEIAEIAVRDADAPGWREAPITAFESGLATDLWVGRTAPSRRATSAPDLAIGRFEPR
ncbi:hypothetical protein [Salinarimonas ramus]|uniref:Uncharacterized protein n=1 Tax=Salinarimonas ramus TaxID=690164 RepID=A0A917Q8L3_9HYPH|nr:hypothetical protein [Salinarimonas ramus]GGK35363.1 hypothetical protein GCM10011322_22750 [Salinarimonas ramus]